MVNELYLTPPKIARQLGVTCEKVLNWIRSGQLRAVNLSSGIRPRWKVRPDDLESFLATKSNQSNIKPSRTRRALPKPVRQWV